MMTHHLTAIRRVRRLILLALGLLLAGLPAQTSFAQGDSTALAGTLAIVGQDNNIYLLDDLAQDPAALTSDAQRGRLSYAWPTWASDGRLAFFAQQRSADRSQSALQILIQEPGAAAPEVAYTSDTETLTYAYWAPATCPISDACRDLAVLVSTPDGLGVIRVRDEAPSYSTERIGLGQPFYFSYSPDATRMLWTRFGQQIELYDTAENEIITILPDSAGRYQAPMWSPVDDRLLFSIIDAGGQHNLVIASDDERLIIAEDQPGILWFTWSPDGAYVAYKHDLGPLMIADSTSGATVALSSRDPVVAFFWSPDSQKIAYLTLPGTDEPAQVARNGVGDTRTDAEAGRVAAGRAAPAPQRGLLTLTWNILTVRSGERWTSYSGFLPTRDMLYLIGYFDQFAQSHQIWSPDSRYLAYGEADPRSNREQVVVLDTVNPAEGAQPIMGGSIAIWSYHR